MKLTVHAEVGRAFVPFLRRQLKLAAERFDDDSVAWASRPSLCGGQPLSRPVTSLKRSGKMPKPRLWALSVVLVGDRRMSALHLEFMNIAGATDVLTFPMEEDSSGRVRSGEVYICVPEARRQAKKSGVEVKLELLLYAIHGMLHLLGYDDTTARAHRAMHDMEDAILTKLGFGPVFHRPGKTVAGQRRTIRKGGRA